MLDFSMMPLTSLFSDKRQADKSPSVTNSPGFYIRELYARAIQTKNRHADEESLSESRTGLETREATQGAHPIH